MKTIDDLLAEHSVFCDLEPAYRKLIAGCARNRVFHGGEMLMKEGDDANEFFAIRKGQVVLAVHMHDRGEVAIETLGAGEIIGLSWLFPPYKVQFDARAVGTVNVIAFDGACLRGKCEADPALGYDLMKRFTRIVTSRLQATRLQFLDMYGDKR